MSVTSGTAIRFYGRLRVAPCDVFETSETFAVGEVSTNGVEFLWPNFTLANSTKGHEDQVSY